MTNFDKFIQPDLTMTIDATSNSFEMSYYWPNGEKEGIKLFTPQNQFKTDLIPLRSELSNWGKKYEELLDESKKDRLSCDPSKVKDMWLYLANEGKTLHTMLFDLVYKRSTDLVELSESIKKLKTGSIIEFDALDAPLPWSLLYDGEIPTPDDPKFFDNLFPHFWGLRYQLVSHPTYGTNNINNNPYLSNADATRLTIAVNQQSDTTYQTGQLSFFTNLKQEFNKLSSQGKNYLLMLGTSKNEVISSLTTRQEPQHLYYLFCHHEKGEGEVNLFGIADYLQETKIIMEGETEGIITLDELEKLVVDKKILPFQEPPVIFLNACHSNQLQMGDPTSFMTYFITGLHSWNFIGTEADIPAPFADAFGKCFVEEFLNGKSVGQVLFELRNSYARDHRNPFGLYYTLFGRSEIHLQNPCNGMSLCHATT
jgi:hypothetical protein